MNHTLSESQLEAMIKSAVNSSGPLPPDEKFSQLISALRELQERRKVERDTEPYGFTDGDRRGMIYKPEHSDRLSEPVPLYRHAQPDASHLSRICAESYQVVGALAEALRIFNDVGVIKALDNLSAQEIIHDDVLPFSVPEAAQQPVVPQDVLDALQKVARIRIDLNDFDGDRRGIADCLGDAEEALIEVVNRRAAMLQAQPQNAPQNIPEIIPNELIAAVNRLLDSNGSRGCYNAIKCYDAHIEVERLLAAARQEVKP